MKVAILHTCYKIRGGEDGVVAHESRCLEEAGIEVTRLFFNNDGSLPTRMMRLLLAPFNPFVFRRVTRWLKRERPDVLHVHNWHFAASPAVFLAARRLGVPVVHSLHNFRLLCPSATLLHNNQLFFDSVHRPFPWLAVRHGVYNNSRLLTFWLAATVALHKRLGTWQGIDRYLVLSENAGALALSSHLRLRAGQVAVKCNSVPDVQAEPRLRGDHFLFVGRLSEEKGIRSLLVAFAQSGLSLRILGEGPLQELVEAQAATHPNIRYLGLGGRTQVIAELQLCTALIFPSIWLEGFPLVMIEAFACATPIIAARMGAMQEIVADGRNGLHFTAGDAADLASKTRQWQQLAEAGRQVIGHTARSDYERLYTPLVNTRKLLDVYRALLHEKGTVQPAISMGGLRKKAWAAET